MANQQYEGLLNNPKVRTMLNLIAQAEGVKWGYNTLFGNQKVGSLAAHPNIRKEFTQTDGKRNYTTAAGRYQFLKGTWDGLAKQYGLSDFSPRSQDIGAIALLAQNGALPYVLKGDYQTAVKKSGGTWASLPSSSYAQPKRGWEFVNKQLGADPHLVKQLTVSDLERQYGKGKTFQLNNESIAPKSNLTVADLERQFGKGKSYFEDSDSKTVNSLTVADLERQYGKGQPYQF